MSTSLLDAFIAAFDEADELRRRQLAERLRPYWPDEPDRVLARKEKAKQLGVHPDTVVRWARQGRMPAAIKVGREWRFPARCEILPSASPPGIAAPEPSARRRPITPPPRTIAAIRGPESVALDGH